MMKIVRSILLTATIILPALGQDADIAADSSAIASTETSIAVSADTSPDTAADTSSVIDTAAAASASSPTSPAETPWLDDDDDDDLDAEFAAADSAETRQKLAVVRREHSYKRQIKLAIIMMTFLVVAMATTQSWNPD